MTKAQYERIKKKKTKPSLFIRLKHEPYAQSPHATVKSGDPPCAKRVFDSAHAICGDSLAIQYQGKQKE
ncbi:hypothetical protein ES288_A10G257100v1 [Gossypium darwinii]|uniref:Uncharacterized protein n=2 Tax=Gossypium TaxID=3633 RepID=A0A5D2NV21_GOSTO|nr:hypothetical protein ES288_A10G257100v1 [Gossypium darwinii]TYI07842.1 hypothetical protein ES332_A10G253400v1 [Gossypium tomentosum]